jgi:glutamine amidotransferase-like uncharacterized protein
MSNWNYNLKINPVFFVMLLLFLAGCGENTRKEKTDAQAKINVGVYDGGGASPVCVIETLEALKIDGGIAGRKISPVDIQSGALNNIDVLIFPGGSGSKEYNSLGQTSATLVQKFAREGGGLVGICAGGYLFATTEGYPSLQILRAQTIRKYYDRGRGLIAFGLDKEGKEIFPELSGYDSLFVQYYDGPMYEILDSAKVNVTAQIISDIATHKGYPKGVTPGRPAFVTASYGKGKVFVSVGHPEATAGMRWMVPRMARWVNDSPLVSYDETVVRPQINNREVLYYPDIIRFEKENFWQLFSNNDREVEEALDNLYSIRSRPSIRWAIGLLRNNSPQVRLNAAAYLLQTEYTYAIPDLECAVLAEKDPGVKKQMAQQLEKLKAITGDQP